MWPVQREEKLNQNKVLLVSQWIANVPNSTQHTRHIPHYGKSKQIHKDCTLYQKVVFFVYNGLQPNVRFIYPSSLKIPVCLPVCLYVCLSVCLQSQMGCCTTPTWAISTAVRVVRPRLWPLPSRSCRRFWRSGTASASSSEDGTTAPEKVRGQKNEQRGRLIADTMVFTR